MTDGQAAPAVNLLWPEGIDASAELERGALDEQAEIDLGIQELLDRLQLRPNLREKLRGILLAPSSRAEVIAYRQAVLQDCLENPPLVEAFEKLLPRLANLGYLAEYPTHTPLEQVTTRLGELEIYVECVRALRAGLEAPGVSLNSEGLRRLREAVAALESGADFQDLAGRLPDLRKQSAGAVSITIGVNLDNQLRPHEATLLAINDRPFRGARDNFISRLFGEGSGARLPEEFRGITRLHTIPDDALDPMLHGLSPREGPPNPLMFPLFRDLDFVMRKSIEPVARALRYFIHLKSAFLVQLEPEIAFYLSGVRLVRELRAAGLPACRPEIAPAEERVCAIDELYNLNLAGRLIDQGGKGAAGTIVTNDITFDDAARIWVLTGPNQGGKTTFTQAVGLAQVLFQLGFYVPGSRARISPADGIFTHFPLQENPQAGTGRLGEEAQRLSAVFRRATRRSLVLLNESLITTSPGESIYLARDVLRALRLYGVRAIFVTHLHELAEDLEALNAGSPGDSRVGSLVAGIQESGGAESPAGEDEPAARTFRIRPAPPMGSSFARDIARRHGISYEQLAAGLRRREES